MLMCRLLLLSLIVAGCGIDRKKDTEFKPDPNSAPMSFPLDCVGDTIEQKLDCIPGLTYKKRDPISGAAPVGYTVYEIQFKQPENHALPAGASFNQKLVLWHRNVNAPMVLQTTGYHLYSEKRAEITQFFNANQLQVEHRFFANSRPQNGDWSKLTVEQSAYDFHRVAQAFHAIYKGKWVNTGASKGGMTSVYHRYFFPNDVDATVAYVAPSSHSVSDDRYNQFLDNVGGDEYADCRGKLSDFQRTLLKRKAEILPQVDGSFSRLGSKELAYEYAVSELFFTFWQYKNPKSTDDGCASVPSAGATPKKLLDTLESINSPNGNYGDDALAEFGSYFYQAARELGAATPRLENIRDLITHQDRDFGLDPVLPANSAPQYDGSTVAKVEAWAKDQSSTMMFIYGGLDSWSAAAFPKPSEANGSYLFTQVGGNHGAKIATLSAADSAQAKQLLRSWLGIPAGKESLKRSSISKSKIIVPYEETTEDDQFKHRR